MCHYAVQFILGFVAPELAIMLFFGSYELSNWRAVFCGSKRSQTPRAQGVVQAGLVAERSVEPSNWKFFTVLYILESVVIKYIAMYNKMRHRLIY